MSQETAAKTDILDFLTPGQKKLVEGFINFSLEKMEVDWDVDQTLALTEYPVKAVVDERFGTNYFSRKIVGYETLTKWLTEDGVTDKKTAQEFESSIWVNADILYQAKPNEFLRDLSYAMYKAKIPQNVTTIRIPGLRISTYKWLQEYFPWIPSGKINFRIGMGMSGHEFKRKTVLDMHAKNPGVVHVDDDSRIIKTLSEDAPGLKIIGIRYPYEDVSGIEYAENRAFLYRDDLNSLINLPPALSY